MKILHGTWIPELTDEFVQPGCFALWVETQTEVQIRKRNGNSQTKAKTKGRSSGKTTSKSAGRSKPPDPKPEPQTSESGIPRHPRHLDHEQLLPWLTDTLGLKPLIHAPKDLKAKHVLLPTAQGSPLPSPEMSLFLEQEIADPETLSYWQIDCYPVRTLIRDGDRYHRACNVIPLLRELHFLTLTQPELVQLGSDLGFWYHFTQRLRQVIERDHYLPALKYQIQGTQQGRSSGKKKKKSGAGLSGNLYPGWEIHSPFYEDLLQQALEWMPLACVSGFSEAPPDPPQCHDRETLLRHFSEFLITDIVTHIPFPQIMENKIKETVISQCKYWRIDQKPLDISAYSKTYQQWQNWRQQLDGIQGDTPLQMVFRLEDPEEIDGPWQLWFQVSSQQDPSLKLDLADYWPLSLAKRRAQAKLFEVDREELERFVLFNLGYAARIYPPLWEGMESDQPEGLSLSLEEAFSFLKEQVWVLEDAGFKTILPAWWTPSGRRRAKLKIKAKSKKIGGSAGKTSYFSGSQLVDYRYELALGDEQIQPQEWEQLVQAKIPLVFWRGEWVELDQSKMQELLELWRSQQDQDQEMSLLELMQKTATGDESVEIEVDPQDALARMWTQLQDKSQLELVDDPPGFQGQLRDYQKRGVAWLGYLDSLGLNGCLADDMGLGKTIEVIAHLLQAAEQEEQTAPTLLIVPTSVLGNWQREINKFAPDLRVMLRHGTDRTQDQDEFLAACQAHDVVITSFTLARMDRDLLKSLIWQRVVIDEAQNIKNPKAAQTKAITSLEARHRLALTGTPVENRLMDLWSIFNFLNPGYLGKQTQFQKTFENPIQRSNSQTKSKMLKRLVEPFILRRVKTDPTIINDLPEKLEQKIYCPLTKEQASLYQAVVKEIEENLKEQEGIARQGLILSSLTRLKQICNHPRQFLQDESEFSPTRSHKLGRLLEMIEEVMQEGESMLIFTQFTEIGEALEATLKGSYHYPTYYLHGGTSQKKRDQMIAAFQDPEADPSIFVLSLKAGGVGITLTQANHVFHFDRWWNPAVENQATDRAYRIGQRKTVFVHKFITLGTLEERIDQKIEDKQKLSESIVGNDESWLSQLDNESFKQLIRLSQAAMVG